MILDVLGNMAACLWAGRYVLTFLVLAVIGLSLFTAGAR